MSAIWAFIPPTTLLCGDTRSTTSSYIVSKDEDFHQMSFLHGSPPKVIWLNVGNCSTSEIEALLREKAEMISEFSEDDQGSFLVLVRDAL